MSAFHPQQFGRYFLVDKIAVGGMAEVFKAKSYSEAGFEKLLVIKRILDHLSDNSDFVDMFIDEAKLSVELQHANIVQIYDYGRATDGPFLIMEYVEGNSLLDKCREGAIPIDEAIEMTCQLCDGLDC